MRRTNLGVIENLLEGVTIEMAVVTSPVHDVEFALHTLSVGASLGLVGAVDAGDGGDVGLEVILGDTILHDNDVVVWNHFAVFVALSLEDCAGISGSECRKEHGQSLKADHFDGCVLGNVKDRRVFKGVEGLCLLMEKKRAKGIKLEGTRANLYSIPCLPFSFQE